MQTIIQDRFTKAIKYGNLEKIKNIWQMSLSKNYKINIHANGEENFILCCQSGYLDVAKWLWQLSLDINSPINIHCREYYENEDIELGEGLCSFEYCCIYGHVNFAKWLWQLSHEIGFPFDIHEWNEYIFRWCCYRNKFRIIEWLWQISLEYNNPIDFRVEDDYAFKISCNNNNIEIAKWLCSLCCDYLIEIEIKNSVISSWKIENIYMNILESINDDIKLHNIFKIKSKKCNKDKENAICLICKSTEEEQKMINLKCNKYNKIHDHYYCVDCFAEWYKNHPKKCVMCTEKIVFDNIVLLE
jgi:hypothetical protein